MKVEILHAAFGFGGGVVMILHNTGARDGRALDEHLAAVFAFEGDRIAPPRHLPFGCRDGRSLLRLTRGPGATE
ncbi:MAG: hypothetical protein WDM85_03995 [Caulobacteraceae bacterium]